MKPFKDTKLGQWLKEKAPKVLDVVGSIIPGKDVFEVVGNMINKSDDIPPEHKLEFERMKQDFEKEIYALEVEDRKSARNREVEFTKATGHIDYMNWFIAIVVMGLTTFLCVSLVYREMPKTNEHVLLLLIGEIIGFAGGIVSYQFGSSAGSRIKDMIQKINR